MTGPTQWTPPAQAETPRTGDLGTATAERRLLSQAEALRMELLSEAQALDRQHTRVTVAKVVGSSLAAAGSLASIASRLALPFVAGDPPSLKPACLGALSTILSVAGSLTSSGASLVQRIQEQRTVAPLEKKRNRFLEIARWQRHVHSSCRVSDVPWNVGEEISQEMVQEGRIIQQQCQGVAEMYRATKDCADDAVDAAMQVTKVSEEVAARSAGEVTEAVVTRGVHGSEEVAAITFTPPAAKSAQDAAERAMTAAGSTTTLDTELHGPVHLSEQALGTGSPATTAVKNVSEASAVFPRDTDVLRPAVRASGSVTDAENVPARAVLQTTGSARDVGKAAGSLVDIMNGSVEGRVTAVTSLTGGASVAKAAVHVAESSARAASPEQTVSSVGHTLYEMTRQVVPGDTAVSRSVTETMASADVAISTADICCSTGKVALTSTPRLPLPTRDAQTPVDFLENTTTEFVSEVAQNLVNTALKRHRPARPPRDIALMARTVSQTHEAESTSKNVLTAATTTVSDYSTILDEVESVSKTSSLSNAFSRAANVLDGSITPATLTDKVVVPSAGDITLMTEAVGAVTADLETADKTPTSFTHLSKTVRSNAKAGSQVINDVTSVLEVGEATCATTGAVQAVSTAVTATCPVLDMPTPVNTTAHIVDKAVGDSKTALSAAQSMKTSLASADTVSSSTATSGSELDGDISAPLAVVESSSSGIVGTDIAQPSTTAGARTAASRAIEGITRAGGVATAAQADTHVALVASKTARAAVETSQTASKVADHLSNMAQSPMVLANLASLGQAFCNIVDAAIQLQKRSRTEAVDQLLQCVQELDPFVWQEGGTWV